ncbi:MAG: dihydrolipoyl dehydrogenase [Eubacterium sp.]|jgi:dihydrolipoamide dehydrogenase|nr:dihydrolipoyl dehydrogenase [Eubacterium sp.]MCH4046999.1 dihydrolipoyl dehydrogenase [Eubacterium sp.]MCH4080096.1 dihydrolipoyl dehydrogenase [Eubacterium sp.]MCH4109862.1 dihydrolipoyl dehydrogenase [Eubacterium sp.]MCI1306728.1 dihydrolipoyl dehydrogenase [Eubacterium sp.]
MATEVKMPQLGLTMEEGTVDEWVKHEGDEVKKGDVLCVIATDKLTNELEAEEDGTLIKIVAQEGEDIPVQGTLAYIGQPGEAVPDAAAPAAETPAAAPAPAASAPAAAAPAPASAPAELDMKGKTVGIIGGGPGGYICAIRCAQLGGKVTVIERANMGGTCVNIGCIPTKVLVHSGDVAASFKDMDDIGVVGEFKGVNWDKVQAKREYIVKRMRSGVTGLMKANKIKVVKGEASFVDSKTLKVTKADGTSENMSFDATVVATGSKNFAPKIPGLDSPEVIDSTGALSLKEQPKSMIIVGGGVIGIEFATAYQEMGTQITILEALPRLLPPMDGELTKELQGILTEQGMDIHLECKVVKIESSANGAKVTVDHNGTEETYEAEKVLVAIGRRSNLDGLNPEAAGLELEKGHIVANDKQETNVPGIYAIGDCVGKTMLAHTAMSMGEVAAENIAGGDSHYGGVEPSAVYANPEFACVGMTEEAVKEAGIPYHVGKFPLTANAKALIENGGKGTIKFIVDDEYGEILGCHILGARASDLISEPAITMDLEGTIDDIIATIHSHPTIYEAVRDAACMAEDRPMNFPPAKKRKK